jgi:hypothetical protein
MESGLGVRNDDSNFARAQARRATPEAVNRRIDQPAVLW